MDSDPNKTKTLVRTEKEERRGGMTTAQTMIIIPLFVFCLGYFFYLFFRYRK